MSAAVTLVLGGARSGKSAHAEALILASGLAPVYIATAHAGDQEMRDRILAHQDRRGAAWTTIEEPLDLAAALTRQAAPGNAILVDCLTLWLSNLYGQERDAGAETERLLAALAAAAGPVVLVSNEVGLGIVPDNALARAFADAAGLLNQRIAHHADRVIFVAAGLPVVLKGAPPV